MKKVEISLIALGLLGFLLTLLNIPGGALFLTLSLTVLSFFYFVFGFALFNDIKIRHIFKIESYKEISVVKIIIAFFAGYFLSVATIGILFRISYFPGAGLMLSVSIFGLTVIAVISIIMFLKSKAAVYKKILFRLVPVLLISINVVLMSAKFWNKGF